MTYENPETQDEEPKDTYSTIRILTFALGVIAFLPWCFITPAHDYWMYKFRNTSINDSSSEFRTLLQTEFAPVCSLSMQITNLFALSLVVMYTHKFKVRTRIMLGLILVLVELALLAILVKVDADSWQLGFFVLTMVIAAIIAASNAFYTIGTIVMLSNLPREYLGYFYNGHSVASILSAALQLLSLTIGMSIQNDALLYFGMGCSLIIITAALFAYSSKNPFYLYQMKKYQKGEKQRIGLDKIKVVMKKIWINIATLFIAVVTIITLHPSVTSLVVSEGEGNGDWNDVYFVPTITFFLSGVADLGGRTLASIIKIDFGQLPVLIFSIARLLVFLPLLMLCNAQSRDHLPVVFQHDYQYIIILTIFSFTHGYIFIVANYSIRNLVETEELEAAYQIVTATIGISMAVFSFTGIVSVLIL